VAQVKIDIATEFTGKKGFKEAETATGKLNKSVKKLAGGLLLAFGTQKILAFGKASVKAFVEDDKAATALGQTLKNLNLAYGSQIGTVNGFINRLEIQTGVLDDELRPAMDRLLRATGDVAKSQELLNLALDISAGTGKSVTQVSQSLQKAYLGQKQALGRLGVGLSKAELETSSFEEVQIRLSELFAGQATAAADTYAGSLAKLTIAGNNAKETIGKGLVDALKTASNSTSTDELITKINSASEAMANFIREGGEFIAITKQIFDFQNLSWKFQDPNAFKGLGNISMTVSSQDTQRAAAAAMAAAAKKAAAEQLKLMKAQAATQAKILKDKKLSIAIDKANIALNKGEEVFDLDKIQIAAALTNQAELLAKTTNQAQILQIANDTARLNVKKSILALEDAIAAKDEAAIIAATAKLNADLKILGALTGQNVKLTDIKSILDTLKPADLINQSNLDKALATIKEMLRLLAEANAQAKTKVPTSASLGSGIPTGDYIAPISTKGGSIEAILEYADAATARANAFADLLDMQSEQDLKDLIAYQKSVGDLGGYSPNMNTGRGYGAGSTNITVNTGIGDPEAIARAIEDAIRQSYQRGTSSTGLLAV
jgi:hypothetical protein